jgi:hypothetical protein
MCRGFHGIGEPCRCNKLVCQEHFADPGSRHGEAFRGGCYGDADRTGGELPLRYLDALVRLGMRAEGRSCRGVRGHRGDVVLEAIKIEQGYWRPQFL